MIDYQNWKGFRSHSKDVLATFDSTTGNDLEVRLVNRT
jgi:hypothetical protein